MTDVLLKVEQAHGDKVLSESDGNNQLPIHLLIVVGQTFGKHEKKIVLERINSSKILLFFFVRLIDCINNNTCFFKNFSLGLLSIGDSLASLKEDLNLAIQSQLLDSVTFGKLIAHSMINYFFYFFMLFIQTSNRCLNSSLNEMKKIKTFFIFLLFHFHFSFSFHFRSRE